MKVKRGLLEKMGGNRNSTEGQRRVMEVDDQQILSIKMSQ